MKIFYTGNICSDDFFSFLAKSQTYPPSYAQLKLEKNIIKGFEQNQIHVTALGQYPIRSFPGNKKLFLSRNVEKQGDYQVIINPFMINILFIKQLVQFLSTFSSFLFWLIKNRREEKVYFSYSVYPPVTLACIGLAKLFRIKSITYVSEVPKLRLYHNQGNSIRKMLLKFLTTVSMSLSNSFSNYVYTTAQTNDFFQANESNYVVVEGMSSIEEQASYPVKNPHNDETIVMYAGGINEQNGIGKLLDTWELLEANFILWLFGDGDYSKILKERVSGKKNIVYWGSKPHSEIIEFEKEASILINPRFSQNEFTKYSFPSKTIEYLESGTPTITSKLEGIPSEYYDYLEVLLETPVEISQQFIKLSEPSNYQLALKKSEAGFEFIRDQKNAEFQMNKIIKMLSLS